MLPITLNQLQYCADTVYLLCNEPITRFRTSHATRRELLVLGMDRRSLDDIPIEAHRDIPVGEIIAFTAQHVFTWRFPLPTVEQHG